METLQDVLTNLLRNLASRREIDQYLREFTDVDSTKFAVIKVGGGILRDARDELASALAFLRRVGLYPIVVHGAGPQINAALDAAGISTTTVDGMRVTTPEVLAIVRKVLHRENLALVETLERCDTRARPITSGVFQAATMDAAHARSSSGPAPRPAMRGGKGATVTVAWYRRGFSTRL